LPIFSVTRSFPGRPGVDGFRSLPGASHEIRDPAHRGARASAERTATMRIRKPAAETDFAFPAAVTIGIVHSRTGEPE
jgi:hypothetical protein